MTSEEQLRLKALEERVAKAERRVLLLELNRAQKRLQDRHLAYVPEPLGPDPMESGRLP